MSSRPRRSAPTSYKHLLQPLTLSSSSSSENDSDSDTTKRKKRFKKSKTSFIPEQESESEFEAGPKGQPEEEDEESENDAVGVSDEDGQSGIGDEDLSDIVESGGELDRASPGPSGRGKKATGRKSTKPAIPKSDAPAPRRSLVVTKKEAPTTTSTPGGGTKEPVRATLKKPIKSNLDPSYAAFVPHFLPPALTLSSSSSSSSSPSSSYSTAPVETSSKKLRGQTDKDASNLLEAFTANPFAPERALVRDVGWEKGKWKEGEGTNGINERWGGWYDEIKLDKENFERVDQSEVDSRLPSQTFQPRPIPFHTLTVSKTKTETPALETDEPDPSTTIDDTQPTQTLGASEPDRTNGKRQVFVGGVKGEGEREVSLERFESVPLKSFIPRKPGHLLNVGGPVSALSWLPRLTGPSTKEYLAIGTISSPSLTLSHPPNLTGSKTTCLVQIWSLTDPHPEETLAVETSEPLEGGEKEEVKKEGMRFEMGLLVGDGEGEARDLQWCPRGGVSRVGKDEMDVDGETTRDGEEDKLGVLAGVFTDGKVKVFVVPTLEKVRENQGVEEKDQGETVYVKAKKVLELRLPDTSCLSLAWGSWETIAAGCMNGSIAVWHVGDALRKGLSTVRPTHYLPSHTCAIRSIAFINTPPRSNSLEALGEFDLSGEPQRIGTVGYDGSVHLTDLRESDGAGTGVVSHERSPAYSIAWSPMSGCLYADDQDDRICAYFTKAVDFGASKRIGAHRGTIWSLATSGHHPFVLSASSDGTVGLHSGVRALRRRRVKLHFSQKVYALEYERETGKWRMRDNWQVEHRQALDSLAIGSSTSHKSTGEPALTSHVAWPQEIQINKVAWHPNLERSALVASGGNWGCVRIDWVEGTGEREA